jgi:hypothetical protein
MLVCSLVQWLACIHSMYVLHDSCRALLYMSALCISVLWYTSKDSTFYQVYCVFHKPTFSSMQYTVWNNTAALRQSVLPVLIHFTKTCKCDNLKYSNGQLHHLEWLQFIPDWLQIVNKSFQTSCTFNIQHCIRKPACVHITWVTQQST